MTQHLREHADWLDGRLAALQQRVDTQDNEIAQMEERIYALENPGPPVAPPQGMLVGLFTDFSNRRNMGWDVLRYYESGGIPWQVPQAVRAQLQAGRAVHLSAKPGVPMNMGERLDLESLFRDAQDLGGHLYMSLWHEPENDSFTAAQWGELQNELVGSASLFDNVTPVFNLMGWGLHASQSGGSNLEYLDVIDGLQSDGIVAIDVYDWPSSKGRPSEDLFDAYTADTVGELKRRNWRWMIAETGTVGDEAHQTSWVLRNMQEASDFGCVVWLLFDKDKPNEPDDRMWAVEMGTLLAMRDWSG